MWERVSRRLESVRGELYLQADLKTVSLKPQIHARLRFQGAKAELNTCRFELAPTVTLNRSNTAPIRPRPTYVCRARIRTSPALYSLHRLFPFPSSNHTNRPILGRRARRAHRLDRRRRRRFRAIVGRAVPSNPSNPRPPPSRCVPARPHSTLHLRETFSSSSCIARERREVYKRHPGRLGLNGGGQFWLTCWTLRFQCWDGVYTIDESVPGFSFASKRGESRELVVGGGVELYAGARCADALCVAWVLDADHVEKESGRDGQARNRPGEVLRDE
uniref:Uncharacterized protein n=1 Tax=Mycena chlorophos TaxID=658473 RepID=A0ABQ0KVD1_MYCCL|nr:predicted protein [Mycena chlorophos]